MLFPSPGAKSERVDEVVTNPMVDPTSASAPRAHVAEGRARGARRAREHSARRDERRSRDRGRFTLAAEMADKLTPDAPTAGDPYDETSEQELL